MEAEREGQEQGEGFRCLKGAIEGAAFYRVRVRLVLNFRCLKGAIEGQYLVDPVTGVATLSMPQRSD